MRQPYASRHACSRTDATLFWTCIKIAKALRDFHGQGRCQKSKAINKDYTHLDLNKLSNAMQKLRALELD